MGGFQAFSAALSRVLQSIKALFEYLILTIVASGPVPQHVAIIMDGNRRFAKQRQMEKNSGHISGSESLIRTVRYLYFLGVKYVTVYAFSVENFGRPKDEVDTLMELLRQRMESVAEHGDIAGLTGVRVRLVGNLKMLPQNVLEAANRAMEVTAMNDRVVLNICVAYSSSNEIVNAVQRSCQRSSFSEEDAIDVKRIEEDLFTAGCPEPDVLIRTSGETRLSNFLLWQTGFCYLHACPALWPEFSLRHIVYAMFCYQKAQKSLQSVRRKYVTENTICNGKSCVSVSE